jgi:hypothetical protein
MGGTALEAVTLPVGESEAYTPLRLMTSAGQLQQSRSVVANSGIAIVISVLDRLGILPVGFVADCVRGSCEAAALTNT